MPKQYTRIMRAICSRPWAIMPDKLDEILAFIEAKQAGMTIDPAIVAQIQAAAPQQRVSGAVAVLPLFGVISQRMNLMTEISGGTSTEKFVKQYRVFIEDPGIKALVLDVASPGGEAFGVEEASAQMFAMRGRKKVVAVSNSMMASAAYYLASAADEVVVSPSSLTGAIGTFSVHTELSKMNEKLGITKTMIKSGKFKGEGNDFEPLTEEAFAAMQSIIDNYDDMFIKSMARNRGLPLATVRKGFGEGRILTAKEAVKAGLADRVATMDETIARLVGRSGTTAVSAQIDLDHELTDPEIAALLNLSALSPEDVVGISPVVKALAAITEGSDAWRTELEREKFELGL